jgi:hypothetical protein
VPWLLWDGGLYTLRGDTPESPVALEVAALTVDDDGRVWFVAQSDGHAALWTLDE